MEQRRAHLKQQESIELNRKQKEERTLLLANAMKQRGIRQTPGFRYPNYWDTYIEGKLPLCVQGTKEKSLLILGKFLLNCSKCLARCLYTDSTATTHVGSL